MAIINSNQIDRTSREYITKNPMRSSIGAVGFGLCNSVNLVVDVVDVSRDVVKLAKLSLKESLIEAETEAKKAELAGMDQLAELELQLAQKRAQLAQA